MYFFFHQNSIDFIYSVVHDGIAFPMLYITLTFKSMFICLFQDYSFLVYNVNVREYFIT